MVLKDTGTVDYQKWGPTGNDNGPSVEDTDEFQTSTVYQQTTFVVSKQELRIQAQDVERYLESQRFTVC